MRCFLSALLLLAMGEASAAGESIDGRVIRVQREAVIYTAPSPQSKPVADVSKDTTLIARKLSPRGTWILVEDEDGNRGWMDRRKTDFRDTPAPAPPPEAPNEIVKQGDAAAEAPIAKRRVWVLKLRARRAFADPHGTWGFGALGQGLFALDEGWLGFETGGLWHGGGGGQTYPFRLLYALPDGGTRLVGADLAVQVLHYPASDWKLDAGMGLFLQRAFAFGGFWGIRAGFDFLATRRFGIELDLGWHF